MIDGAHATLLRRPQAPDWEDCRSLRQTVNYPKFTATTAARQAMVARRVPLNILARAIQTGRRMADPQAAAGAIKIVSDMYKNGKLYQLEIIYREADKMILHFHYQ